MARVTLNRGAIEALASDPGITRGLDQVGAEVAAKARQLAPKRTGAGAASVHHELGRDSRGAFVRIGPDSAHHYMIFQELGTSKMPAHPFLRPALDGSVNL